MNRPRRKVGQTESTPMKVMYLHTLDGKPASYDPRSQLILIHNRRDPVKLAHSWQQIKREQRRASSYVRDRNYGYQRVEVPS
jgi:hypothetical protein